MEQVGEPAFYLLQLGVDAGVQAAASEIEDNGATIKGRVCENLHTGRQRKLVQTALDKIRVGGVSAQAARFRCVDLFHSSLDDPKDRPRVYGQLTMQDLARDGKRKMNDIPLGLSAERRAQRGHFHSGLDELIHCCGEFGSDPGFARHLAFPARGSACLLDADSVFGLDPGDLPFFRRRVAGLGRGMIA